LLCLLQHVFRKIVANQPGVGKMLFYRRAQRAGSAAQIGNFKGFMGCKGYVLHYRLYHLTVKRYYRGNNMVVNNRFVVEVVLNVAVSIGIHLRRQFGGLKTQAPFV